MSWRAGSCLHEIFGASKGDGLAKGRAPKPRAAQLSLCKPEKLVSPDVLVIPSWYHTLLFRQYPGYCTDGISPRNQTLHRTIELRSSSPPRSPRSGAMSIRYSQRRLSKSEVTIDCYSEKRSIPSPWSGSAPTGARAWGGPPVEYKRQDKNRFFRAGNLGYTNMRSPLPSTHRSFRLQFARHMGVQKDTLQWRHSYCWASDPFRFYIYY